MKKHITILSLIIIVIFTISTFAMSVTAKDSVVSVKISDFAEIQNFYSFSPDYNDICVMENNKICFTTQGRLYIYDLAKHSLVDNVLLSEESGDIHFTNWIKLLSNENILIMQNKEISGEPFDYKGSKTLIKIIHQKRKESFLRKKYPVCQIGIMQLQNYLKIC